MVAEVEAWASRRSSLSARRQTAACNPTGASHETQRDIAHVEDSAAPPEYQQHHRPERELRWRIFDAKPLPLEKAGHRGQHYIWQRRGLLAINKGYRKEASWHRPLEALDIPEISGKGHCVVTSGNTGVAMSSSFLATNDCSPPSSHTRRSGAPR